MIHRGAVGRHRDLVIGGRLFDLDGELVVDREQLVVEERDRRRRLELLRRLVRGGFSTTAVHGFGLELGRRLLEVVLDRLSNRRFFGLEVLDRRGVAIGLESCSIPPS